MPTPKKKKSGESKFITHEHLDAIGEVAIYYGFMPFKSPAVSKADIDVSKDILDSDYVDDETDNHNKLPLHVEEKIALLRMYQERDMQSLSQPVMMYFKDTCRGALKKSGYHRYADLEIIGSSGPIAEAVLIQTASVMLKEQGYEKTIVEINSIGDHDSMTRFSRELTAYYRKHINEMNPECRQLMKRSVFDLLSSRIPGSKEINAGAPRSMDFLSELSRRHLEEVLEYLEKLNIPYTINNTLIGNRKYCTETIFTIINADVADKKSSTQRILAIGVRYNSLAKRLGTKRDVHGVGISILTPNTDKTLREPLLKTKRPIASFVQLGLESKLASLGVIESLRAAKIPVCLSLAKDRLGAQVSSVEKSNTPYVIVIGKKEAVEKTAIVRRNDTHAQELVPLADLPKYMKRLESELK
jgi:histidyl-tRNA synthetase